MPVLCPYERRCFERSQTEKVNLSHTQNVYLLQEEVKSTPFLKSSDL